MPAEVVAHQVTKAPTMYIWPWPKFTSRATPSSRVQPMAISA
ncbi:Uncharacterised protein [Bordetella pertussis]|nr:Uncharacterised protein [Bordetella pertussis]CFU08124.1 Uncharacterised protein [Bordetella pertussis]CFW00346.1 Uncharacterised protein [Bordetella pertussis]CFW45238.1 Uncharacterised protein [Bordetella pertussis]CPJ85214.1 Uncharacterised protein [Bordetella pertussis]